MFTKIRVIQIMIKLQFPMFSGISACPGEEMQLPGMAAAAQLQDGAAGAWYSYDAFREWFEKEAI